MKIFVLRFICFFPDIGFPFDFLDQAIVAGGLDEVEFNAFAGQLPKPGAISQWLQNNSPGKTMVRDKQHEQRQSDTIDEFHTK